MDNANYLLSVCVFLGTTYSVTEMTGGVIQQILRRKLHPRFTVSHWLSLHVNWMLLHLIAFLGPYMFS